MRKRQPNGKEVKEMNAEGVRSRRKKGDQLGSVSRGGKAKSEETERGEQRKRWGGGGEDQQKANL